MGILVILLLIVLGILGAAPLILSKKPNAGGMITKIDPYAGYLGIAGIIVALIYTLDVIRSLSAIDAAPVLVLMGIIAWAVLLGLGIIFGYGLISQKMLASNDAARAKGDNLRAKLLKYQVPMGIAAIVIGILLLLMRL